MIKGVGINPAKDAKKRGQIKFKMLVDAVQSVEKFMKIFSVNLNDINF